MMASQFLKKGEAMFFSALLFVLIFPGFMHAADFFDGEAYSKINAVQVSWARPLLARIKQDTHEAILDIGCGTGEITAEIALNFPKALVHGIDPSLSMIEYGRKKFDLHQNLNFIQGSVPRYLEDCKAGMYSTIVSFSALHWLPYMHLKKTIQAAHNVVKPGGACYFLLAGKRENKQLDFLTQAVNAVIKSNKWESFFESDDICGLEDTLCMLTLKEFEDIAQESGFATRDIKLKKVEHIFTSSQSFKEWLDGVSPYKKIVGDKHDLFLDTVVQEYCKICPAGLDGSLSYPDYMIYAILKKN